MNVIFVYCIMGFGSILSHNNLFLFHMVYCVFVPHASFIYLLLLLFHVSSSVKISRVEVFDVANLVFALDSVVVKAKPPFP